MKERPILFSSGMVRAILDGRKTQTRRVVKQKPYFPTDPGIGYAVERERIKCPYGIPGDRLWVRETWAHIFECGHYNHLHGDKLRYIYRVDNGCIPDKWRPSIFMPRKASRITLEITAIRVERLQDISEKDSIAEGSQIPCAQLPKSCQQGTFTERTQFSRIWDSINAKKYLWASNPWVWVIGFKKETERREG